MSKEVDDAKLLVTLLKVIKNQNTKLSEELKISLKTRIDEIVIPSPDRGDAGDAGPQGIPGIQGDPGEKGPVGPKGVKGVKGDLGDPGNTGARGEQGVQGDPGIRGLQGSQGIQGEVGPQGIQGETGAKGDKGLDGIDGATGIDGKDGIDGATGVDGKDGTDGVNGKNGVAGKDGVDGVDGKDGKDGAPGENGAQGEKGDPGSDANVAPLEKKFQELSKTVDTKLSKIAYSAVTGTSAGSGEVNLRNLDDIDYNSVSSPTNGHVLIYNSTLGKWQANTGGGGGAATNLNNLVSTSINASLIPGVNSTIDLGSSSKRWKDIYLSGNSIIIGSSIIGAVGAVINLPVGSTIAGAPIGSSSGVSTVTFNSALANTNSSISNVKTGLTSTNTALRTLVSDRLQVANASAVYQTKATERAALANTNSFIKSQLANTNLSISNVKTGLTSTNTALRTLISDRLQVANASATNQTKAVERAALANTNSAISNVKTGLTSTNTALRTLISDSLQVANAATLYTTKSNPTTSGLLAHTGRATISTNLNVSGNTVIGKLVANGSLGTGGYALKTNGSTVYWDAVGAGGGSTTQYITVVNANALFATKAYAAANSYVKSVLANTNISISNVKTGLTSTNTALRTLISDRLQVANAAARLANTNLAITNVKTGLTSTNTALRILIDDRLQVANAAARLANTNLAITNVNTNLTSTNTALRTLISDRLQVANASAVYQTKATERAALANTNSFIKSQLANTNLAISNVKTGLTSTNTALRTLISDRLQVANAATLYTTKSNPTTSGLLAHTGRATISTNLAVSGNTVIGKLSANSSLGSNGFVLKSNGSTVYWGQISPTAIVSSLTQNDVVYTTSDYRLKENVLRMVGGLNNVMKLNPVEYTWKDNGSSGQGFIAHELQSVVPDSVIGQKDEVYIEKYEISPHITATYDERGNPLTPEVDAVFGEREIPKYQSIDKSFLVAILTSAIQEQQTIIESLTNRISALERK